MRYFFTKTAKVFSLITVIVLISSLFAVTAFASEGKNDWLDIIQNVFSNNSEEHTLAPEERDSLSEEYTESAKTVDEEAVPLEYSNPETEFKAVIEDDADLIKDKTALLEEMKPITEFGHVIFKSINRNSKSAMLYAYEYLHGKFGTESSTIFLIDMDNRELYIRSDGAISKMVTNAKSSVITDNAYTYAGKGDYDTCSLIVFSQTADVLRGYAIAEPMHIIGIAIISLLLGMIICFIIINKVSSKKAAGYTELMKGTDTSIRCGEISTWYLRTDKKKIEKSSYHGGGGGGGFSGGGGGGGFSGSGGGHRF